MTEKLMKPALPCDVAEAIEKFLAEDIGRTNEEMRSILVAEHWGKDWRKYELGQYEALNNIPTFDLMSALVNGYQIEQSPEEKLREYYEILVDKERKEWDMKGGVNNYFYERSGIITALNILGIQIEGINAGGDS